MMKPQVSGLGFVCCLVQFEGGVPPACPKSKSGTLQGALGRQFAQVERQVISNPETVLQRPGSHSAQMALKSHQQSGSC